MLRNRLALFAKSLGKSPKFATCAKRDLYTDQIYPYPHNYINTKKWPGYYTYRENFEMPPWYNKETFTTKWMMRLFWFYFFINLYNDPGVLLGHHTFPDPSKWTDEELGIPPEDIGSYKEWLASKEISED